MSKAHNAAANELVNPSTPSPVVNLISLIPKGVWPKSVYPYVEFTVNLLCK